MANTLVTAVGKAICAASIGTTRPGGSTPGNAAPKYVCHGGYVTGTKTGAVTDGGLLWERETRVSGTESTVTTTYTADTYQVAGTISVTATYSANEAMLNDTSGSAAFHTTANGATGTGTSITVNGAGPAAAFVAQVEDELWNVTSGGTTTTWTVTRGYTLSGANGNTTSVSHATSSDIGRVVGNMFTSATFTGIGVNNGDSVAYTWKIQFS